MFRGALGRTGGGVFAVCVAACGVAASVAEAQQTIRVPDDFPTLTLALNPAVSGLSAGDTIELDAGIGYFDSYTVSVPDVTIRGVNGRAVVNPFGTGRAFEVTASGGTAAFVDLRMVNGDAGAGDGGAIFSGLGGSVRVVGCEFDGNIADSGGAIYVVDADLSIGDSVFTDNAAARFAGAVRTGGDGVVVSIVGATFENNDALDGNGGAIDHSGAGAIVEVFDSVFSGNTATSTGAAIFANLASDVTLLRCGFFDNVAVGTGSEDTGGAYISGTARVLVEDCDFERNLAPGSGGGLRFNNSSGSVVGSRFIGNEASRGGAILVVGNGLDVSIFNSKFSGNSARRQGADTNTGGAVSASGTTSGPNLSVYNSLFTGNTAVSAGAIEVASFADAVINNCTFVDNDADAIGGAIRRASTTATTVVNSSLAWDNVPSGSQIAIGGSGLDEVNFSLVEGGYSAVGIGNIDADPLFVDAANGDYSLSAGSPAIDAGSSARYGAGPLSDLAGGVRGRDDPATADTGEAVFGAVIDIGAFEFAPAGDDPVDTCPADIDGDGLIELDDLLAVLSDFGTACP